MKRKHSVIYTWISSYVLILVLFIISGILMERIATNKLIEEYKEITGTLQEQANDSLQTYFQKMKNQATEICSDSIIVSYALSAQPDGANYHNLILMQERLRNQMLTAQDEVMLYLYLDNIKKAVSSSTVYDGDATPAKFFDQDGNEIIFNQGKTWICNIWDEYSEFVEYEQEKDS